MDIVCHHCGALHWAQEAIKNSTAQLPCFGMCCNHGQVRLPPAVDPPYALQQLLSGETPQSQEFRENIRQYNAALAFTSLGVAIDESINNGRGPYVFWIHGELCHRIGSLLPAEGRSPAYAQLYIYDPRAVLDQRMQRNSNLRRDTMELLQHMLERHHFYAGIYKHAHEILSEHDGVEDISINLRVDNSRDRRRYNLPTAEELAVILPGNGAQPSESRDIVLRQRDGPLRRVHDGHPAYAPLHYVLLFPHGEDGWSWELRQHVSAGQQPRRLSQTRFYAYCIQHRENTFPTILRGGRLFQQYLVDMWASADQNRLNYLLKNQNQIRASLYSGLEDAIATADGVIDLNELGQRIILPSSYIGGPRHMQQLYQDSMAVGRYYKKVDLFITMTANP
ncbi:hypothetical protein BD410DRAFT_702923, partial [Rickenella mellea]